MREEELIKKGWEKRGIYNEPRLSEVCEFYRELGFDVIVLAYKGDVKGECGICYGESNRDFKVVFTKKIKE